MRCTHERVLIVLLFLHLWLAASSLKELQVAVELILGAWLLALAARCRLTMWEVLLVALYCASMLASLAFADLAATLLNSKIFGLAVLSLIVFSKYKFDLRPAHAILSLNLALTVFQGVFGDPAPIVWLMQNVAGSWRGIINSRPTGLFMSTHISASLAALFLIWLGYNRRLFGLGIVCLILSRSFFNLAAYLGQLAANLLVRMRLAKLTMACILVAVGFIGLFAQQIRDVDLASLSSVFTLREQISYDVVIGQVLSPDAYKQAFTFIPSDSKKLAGVIFAGSEFGNEIGYFTLLQQGGIFLAVVYLSMLVARVRGFRVFVALSMFHYGMVTPPVAVFLMVQWSRALCADRTLLLEPNRGRRWMARLSGRSGTKRSGAESAPST